MVWEH